MISPKTWIPLAQQGSRRLLRKLDLWDRQHSQAKYWIALILVAVYTLVLSDRPLWEYLRIQRRQMYLQGEIDRYLPIYQSDSARLQQIKTGRDPIVRIARERYLMKSPGEDIYIIKPAPVVQ